MTNPNDDLEKAANDYLLEKYKRPPNQCGFGYADFLAGAAYAKEGHTPNTEVEKLVEALRKYEQMVWLSTMEGPIWAAKDALEAYDQFRKKAK